MEQMQQEMPSEMPESEDQGGTSIEIMVKKDGTMTISVEDGDMEGAEKSEMPVESKEQALKAVSGLLDEILAGTQSPDKMQEQAAFDQEMKAGM